MNNGLSSFLTWRNIFFSLIMGVAVGLFFASCVITYVSLWFFTFPLILLPFTVGFLPTTIICLFLTHNLPVVKPHKIIIFIAILWIVSVVGPIFVRQAQFAIISVHDMPLFTDATITERRQQIFRADNNPSISYSLRSDATQENILNFYMEALPKAGWSLVSSSRELQPDGQFFMEKRSFTKGRNKLQLVILEEDELVGCINNDCRYGEIRKVFRKVRLSILIGDIFEDYLN